MKRIVLVLLAALALVVAAGCGERGAAPSPEGAGAPGLPEVFDASRVLREVCMVSELRKADWLGEQVWLKLESQQAVRSFKMRGAYYMVSRLDEAQRAKGLVTCSAGNHAQGVAYAAQRFGCRATIFVPASIPLPKLQALRSYSSADVRLVEGAFDDAQAEALRFVEAEGGTYVPPFDHADVVAGQGTVGLEIMRQLPDAEAVLVPIGGGGLAAGIATAVKALNPGCKVYGVEPANANCMERAMAEGGRVTLDSASTLADGCAVKTPGVLTFDICRRLLDGVVSVSEEEIGAAVALLHQTGGIVAEGAGALPTAALLSGKLPLEGKRTVCLVSGGNIDPAKLAELVEAHAVEGGRFADAVRRFDGDWLVEGRRFHAISFPTEASAVLLVQGGKANLGCGFFSMATADRLGERWAVASAPTLERLLDATVLEASQAAQACGVVPGETTGREALLRMER